MSQAERYRQLALKCRSLASRIFAKEAARRLRQFADAYDAEAHRFEKPKAEPR